MDLELSYRLPGLNGMQVKEPDRILKLSVQIPGNNESLFFIPNDVLPVV